VVLSVLDDLAYVAQYAAIEAVSSTHVENEAVSPMDQDEDHPPVDNIIKIDSNSDSESEDGGNNDNEVIEDEDESEEEEEEDRTAVRTQWKDLLTEEEAESVAAGPPRTKHEVEEEALKPPVQRLEVDTSSLQSAGKLLYWIEQECAAVVRASGGVTLCEGSLLCRGDALVLGAVQEVFGPVYEPFYVVRYGKDNKPQPKDFPVDCVLFSSSQHANFLAPEVLKTLQSKGSDASNAYDEEVETIYSVTFSLF
jgi:hypothetical protein